MATPHARAGSDEHEDWDAYKLRFSLFWFYSQPSGRFTSENRTGFFDLQRDVGFNSYSTFYGKVDWKFTRKNHLFLSATDFDQSKMFRLNRTIVFRGQTYPVNTVSNASLHNRFLTPGYQYDIFRRKQWNLGFQVNLNIIDVSGSFNAAAQVKARGGRYVIKDAPPLIYHDPHIMASGEAIERALALYRESLSNARRVLLDRYKVMDFALKVVGVGSVGTLCAVALLMAAGDDPLFIQIKEAGPSVLENYLGKSAYPNHGHRVVAGQHLMQAASDIFLGWTHGQGKRNFYLRQLRDMKVKPLVELFKPVDLFTYAMLCGWTLARAHARSGDPARIAGYMGKSDVFDKALAAFGKTYADQTEKDHAAFKNAIRQGRIEVQADA